MKARIVLTMASGGTVALDVDASKGVTERERRLIQDMMHTLTGYRGIATSSSEEGAETRLVSDTAPILEADLSSVPFEPTTNGARDQEYRCTTPMCGESGVCAACRKRGMR